MEYRIARLRFPGSVHIGSDLSGVGREEVSQFIHADTFTGALINAFAGYNSQALDIFVEAISQGSLLISSCMPFSSEGTDFVFRPAWPLNFSLLDAIIDSPRVSTKEWKRLQFAPLDFFKKWCHNSSVNLEDVSVALSQSKILGREIQNTYRTHHAQDRLTDASMIYHIGYTHFAQGSGLYCLFGRDADSPVTWDLLSSGLQQLGMQGIGGRRSVGAGQFEFDTFELVSESWNALLQTGSATHYTSLSPVAIQQPQDMDDLVSFELISRRGWSGNSAGTQQFRKKSVYFIAEGSLFSNQIPGAVLDVKPPNFTDHPIYQSGMPFYVGVQSERTEI